MRRALVTGGNRGIGLAIASGLKREGFDVVVGARDPAAGREAAEQLGVGWVALDLTDPDAPERALAETGPLEVLINNAGILEDVALFAPGDNFARSLEVMVTAPYRLIRAALPGMAAAGTGRIVNLSSGWGSFDEGLGGGGAYGVAKAALNALTLRADREMPKGVKINAMCPGWVRTRMGGAAATRSPEEGAATALWLATLPDDGPSGSFFRDKKRIAW